MQAMDWNGLKVFLANARSGSLSGAARDLGVNHSTIFRRLNSFEAELGARLFERIQGSYELTANGDELLRSAQTIDESFHDLQQRIAGRDVQPRGLVRITAPNNIVYRYLSASLFEFNRQYPLIQTEILVSNLEFNINNRQADIAIRATSTPPDYLVGRQVSTFGWSVFASTAYKKRFGLPRSIDELNAHKLVSGAGGLRGLPAYAWLEKKLPETIRARCDDLYAMSCFTESGYALSILPDDQARPELLPLFAFPPGQTSNLWLLTHPDLRNVERIRLTMQFLADVFASHAH